MSIAPTTRIGPRKTMEQQLGDTGCGNSCTAGNGGTPRFCLRGGLDACSGFSHRDSRTRGGRDVFD